MVSLLALVIVSQSNKAHPLRTLFGVDGSLVFVGLGFPGANAKLLYQPASGRAVGVHDLADLAGHVHIDNSAAALNYVRLQGSQVLVGAMTLDCEVADKTRLLADPTYRDYAFGLDAQLKRLTRLRPGMYGLADAELLKESHIRVAMVRPSGHSFVVTRTLMGFGPKDELELRTIRERVGPRGSYARYVTRRRKAGPPWFFIGGA